LFSSSRAGLFSWDGSAWREGGKGLFKLNLSVPGSEASEDYHRSGRFIMRAHQTFRVLLNTPIFKQMKIGDSKGNEPTGKSLSFSVIEKGKPTPYLIRVSASVKVYYET
jgi:Ran-binding protein 3